MPYTAAACPNCKRRMVEVSKTKTKLTPEERAAQWSPKWANGQKPSNKGMIGGLIAAAITIVLVLFCCSSGNESPEEKRAKERYEEMRPVREEMNRKVNQGKTREEAAREIVNEEVKRQEQNK